MGKMHRGVDVLLLSLRVCHDQIRRDLAYISASTDEVLHGLLKFMGIDFPARVALPGIRTALKAQIKRPKTCLHHAVRQVFGNKPGIKGIRRMEVRLQPALHDLAQEGQQDLVWLEQQGIIIERDMLRATPAKPGKLRQRALERARRKGWVHLRHRTVGTLEGTAIGEFYYAYTQVCIGLPEGHLLQWRGKTQQLPEGFEMVTVDHQVST